MQNEEASTKKSEHLRKIINDPWYFASTCVRTLDQADKDIPVKPFPSHFEYLKLYFKLWQKHPFIAVPKSRRMFISWATITLYVWDTAFHVGRYNAFVSKKESDADDLVKRAKFILDNIPEDVLPRDLIPKYNYKYCTLEFPEIDSKIQGFPQGSDQLRTFTFSGIFGDEAAFWENAQKMYAASLPTLQGGGRMTMVSSPAPGFFKALVHDQLDEFSSNTLGDSNVQ